MDLLHGENNEREKISFTSFHMSMSPFMNAWNPLSSIDLLGRTSVIVDWNRRAKDEITNKQLRQMQWRKLWIFEECQYGMRKQWDHCWLCRKQLWMCLFVPCLIGKKYGVVFSTSLRQRDEWCNRQTPYVWSVQVESNMHCSIIAPIHLDTPINNIPLLSARLLASSDPTSVILVSPSTGFLQGICLVWTSVTVDVLLD